MQTLIAVIIKDSSDDNTFIACSNLNDRCRLFCAPQLLEKDASKRLGTVGCIHGDVKQQAFFQPIDWERLEKRDLEPPFKPKLVSHMQWPHLLLGTFSKLLINLYFAVQKHSLDVQYFDTTFTKEVARLTPVDKEILRSMDQTQFEGFSYTNPHTTD